MASFQPPPVIGTVEDGKIVFTPEEWQALMDWLQMLADAN